MTSNLVGRIFQHKNKEAKGFTEKYNVDKLVFYENFSTAMDAIAAEKRIKGWTRQKKIDLNELPRSKLTGYPPKTTVAAGYVIAYNLLSLDF